MPAVAQRHEKREEGTYVDANRFDTLTKRLAGTADRRRVLGGLGGLVLGVLGRRATTSTAAAEGAEVGGEFSGGCDGCKGRCRKVLGNCRKTCRHGDQPCKQQCDGKQRKYKKCRRYCKRVCSCTPDYAAACAGRSCGEATNNCGDEVFCGSPCATGTTCTPEGRCLCVPCTGGPNVPAGCTCLTACVNNVCQA